MIKHFLNAHNKLITDIKKSCDINVKDNRINISFILNMLLLVFSVVGVILTAINTSLMYMIVLLVILIIVNIYAFLTLTDWVNNYDN